MASSQKINKPNAKRKSRRGNDTNDGTRRSSRRLQDAKAKVKEAVDDPLVDVETEKAKRWMVERSFHGGRRARSDARDGALRAPPTRKRSPTPSPATEAPSLAAVTVDDLREYERDAFAALREWKRARARELGYSDPCIICHNRTLVEMCRRVPKDEEALLGIWGVGANRLRQHGALMLAALAPWREQLTKGHAACAPRGAAANEGAPAQDWLNKATALGLPTGPWDDRRAWCARRHACRACRRHGPGAPWAACTQRLLNLLEQRHGGRDAGWRWWARPVGSAHLHRWWPPQSICDEERLSARDLPLGTMAVLELLQKRNRNKRMKSG